MRSRVRSRVWRDPALIASGGGPSLSNTSRTLLTAFSTIDWQTSDWTDPRSEPLGLGESLPRAHCLRWSDHAPRSHRCVLLRRLGGCCGGWIAMGRSTSRRHVDVAAVPACLVHSELIHLGALAFVVRCAPEGSCYAQGYLSVRSGRNEAATGLAGSSMKRMAQLPTGSWPSGRYGAATALVAPVAELTRKHSLLLAGSVDNRSKARALR